jgi:hypothetical protein
MLLLWILTNKSSIHLLRDFHKGRRKTHLDLGGITSVTQGKIVSLTLRQVTRFSLRRVRNFPLGRVI